MNYKKKLRGKPRAFIFDWPWSVFFINALYKRHNLASALKIPRIGKTKNQHFFTRAKMEGFFKNRSLVSLIDGSNKFTVIYPYA